MCHTQQNISVLFCFSLPTFFLHGGRTTVLESIGHSAVRCTIRKIIANGNTKCRRFGWRRERDLWTGGKGGLYYGGPVPTEGQFIL